MQRFLLILLWLMCVVAPARFAGAVEAIRVPADAQAIDLTNVVERNFSQGDQLQVSTAPDAGGVVRRILVDAREAGTQPAWIVFALNNDSDEQIERLLVAPHYRLVGSGVLSPDLGSSRISAITASAGAAPDREDADDSDIFRLTLEPGATITYVAELHSPNLPQLYLWEPDAYKDKIGSLTLFKGIVIGIAGLLALFLTIVFVVKGAAVFPAAAALAWVVLVYVCIDFGFWTKILGGAASDQIWRATAETSLAATLSVFLFAYLNLANWHVRASYVVAGWVTLLACLVGLAIYDPSAAAGVARISLATVAGVGLILVGHLALRGVDRAIMLVPTWLLLSMWVCGAGLAVTASLTNDLVSPALIGGLVLIIMLIGFTVMQTAFSGSGLAEGAISDAERKALALTGSGDAVFDWQVSSDRVYVSPEIERHLGLKRGDLEGPASSWFDVLHPADSDRYQACLDTVLEQRRGRINLDFRLRGADGQHVWFRLKARPVVNVEGDVARVVGSIADINEQKIAEERMLHDSVHDNLTGLPHRELFFDRLDHALRGASDSPNSRPAVIAIDFDRFRNVNDAAGMNAGDSILLTAARRLGRQLHPRDTLARVSSDQFAIIVLSETDSAGIMRLAEIARKEISRPVTFNEHEIALTASIGIALYDPQAHPKSGDMLKDAEIAVAHAKRYGGDRIEIYKPAMAQRRGDRLSIESDLRRALDRGEMKVFFQPIVRLEDRTIAGFEALLRWDHPRQGRLSPAAFIPLAEETGLILNLGQFALDRAARELAIWQRALDVDPPLFVSVNVSSRQLLRHDLINDVKSALTRHQVRPGTLKLELTESLVMENPEYAAQVLTRIRELGAGLSLDDFGTGYSSLAYLQRFPFDTIKIDRMFVHPTEKGERPALLRSIVALAHDLNMEVVAEGAEIESDVIELFQLGCEFAQGYAFGQPVDTLEARKMLGAGSNAA